MRQQMSALFGLRHGKTPAVRNCRTDLSRMTPHSLSDRIATLPKAELHLHLEGSIQPATVCVLTARHGIVITEEEVRRRYAYRDFPEFIETFKWVTSFLREPQDYALIARDLAEHLFTQHVVYTEVTLSIGVMLLRKQQPEANVEALLRATEQFESRGLRVRWVFDAARQFGAAAAMEVVESAKRCNSKSIVAFGIGGDELSVPTKEFRGVYDRAAQLGLHRLMHAGEVGGPEKIREAIELLGAERMIPLEICPASNMNTGALARQLKLQNATIENHPLPKLLRHGIPVVLSTDDPAMFHTTLNEEYANAARMGLVEEELARIVEMGFEHAFSPVGEGRGA
ncbi:MAG: adenosine deaminase [Acidobacteria bacterium]|nr:MAG: adenosine deaminase [Acidobacteriota bacterium]